MRLLFFLRTAILTRFVCSQRLAVGAGRHVDFADLLHAARHRQVLGLQALELRADHQAVAVQQGRAGEARAPQGDASQGQQLPRAGSSRAQGRQHGRLLAQAAALPPAA